jgi:FtsP/CotA-like multicopper oxidase with cupredoxin domain
MRIHRRAFLGAGVGLAVWAHGPGAAQTAAAPQAPDGFWLLEAGPADARLAASPAPACRALGYGARTPGPLVRLRMGEALKVRLANGLKEPTTLSWPGLRMPNASAGIGGLTQAAVAPGAKADISFTPPDSGFNIYRPHAGAGTAAQIARGLYGPIIVDEAAPPAVDLDLVAVLSDWRLDDDGQIKDDFADPSTSRGPGRIGPLVSANGLPLPVPISLAPGARVRLRLANAANARIMAIAIDGVIPQIVAIDGQPCEVFAPLRNLFPMGPGARFELMFDMPREGAARFILKGGDAGALPSEPDRPLIVFNANGLAAPPRPAFSGLADNPRLPAEIDLARAARIDLVIAGGGAARFSINGATSADWPARPLFAVARGAPVTIGLINKTSVAQAMRLHGHCMRLLHAKDDGWEPYWRDIALAGPGQTVHAAFVADNSGKWPLESAIPEHQQAGVMSWFEVK